MEDELKFADPSTDSASTPPWKILVADDDESIHLVTKLALSGVRPHARPLELLHAYSGGEAVDIMKHNTDVALVLMDVVMDNEHDGLDAVQRIRTELKNPFVRIVVRTGQPGQAPERKVVSEYEINDYREKTELTAQKLFTVVHTGVGCYSQLRTLEDHCRNAVR